MKDLSPHIHCNHVLFWISNQHESFIDGNNKVFLFKKQIHNQPIKLNGFIQWMNYLVRETASNKLIRQRIPR